MGLENWKGWFYETKYSIKGERHCYMLLVSSDEYSILLLLSLPLCVDTLHKHKHQKI